MLIYLDDYVRYLSLLVALLGLLIFVTSTHPKISQLALWAWGAGLLAFLIQFSTHTIGK
jgi:hypothetical protein